MYRYLGLFLLVLRVGFAQNVHSTLSSGNVTVGAELLDGGSDLVGSGTGNHLHDRVRGGNRVAARGVSHVSSTMQPESEVVQHLTLERSPC